MSYINAPEGFVHQDFTEEESRKIVFKFQQQVKNLGGKRGELGLPLGKFKWEFREFFNVQNTEQLEHIVKLIDRDNNGYVSLDELIAYLMLDPLSDTYKWIKGKPNPRARPKGYRYSITSQDSAGAAAAAVGGGSAGLAEAYNYKHNAAAAT